MGRTSGDVVGRSPSDRPGVRSGEFQLAIFRKNWPETAENAGIWSIRGLVGYRNATEAASSSKMTGDQSMAEELGDIAARMVTQGKGILAADESSGTIKKRFDSIGLAATEDSRRDYRELLFRADEAMKKYISGVILYDETIRQKAKDGTPLVEVIAKTGAVPGIKVDMGAKPLPFQPGETITEGLDGLRERLKEYYGLGARFATPTPTPSPATPPFVRRRRSSRSSSRRC
jgi:hypothetical protein